MGGFLSVRVYPPPAKPASAAALQQLVALLAAHEPDLTDHLLELCKPRHCAAHKRELPPHPEGKMGTFAVKVPEGTKVIVFQAFLYCTSLTEITLPAALTEIRAQAFMGCTSLAEITLPPALTRWTRPGSLDRTSVG